MRNFRFLSVLFIFLACNFIHAQYDYASIKKNVNARAKALFHDLNASKDTLILRSSNKMFRVYTVGEFSGLIDQYLNSYEYEVPLRGLKQGKYVFVVDQSKKKIVFQVLIHDPFHVDSASLVDQDSEKFVPKIQIDAVQSLKDIANELLRLSAENLNAHLENELRMAQLKLAEERERKELEAIEREREAKLLLAEKAEEDARLRGLGSSSYSRAEDIRAKRVTTKRPEHAGGLSLSYQLNKRVRDKVDTKKTPSQPKEPINKLTLLYGYKPYNISDKEREGIQSRADKRIEMGLDKKKTEQKVVNNNQE